MFQLGFYDPAYHPEPVCSAGLPFAPDSFNSKEFLQVGRPVVLFMLNFTRKPHRDALVWFFFFFWKIITDQILQCGP